MITITTYFWRCVTISSKELQINEEIRDKEVRVIGSDGSQQHYACGKALDLAAEKRFGSCKIAPQATPPVCKIIDYGKYKFEQTKREKRSKKESARG